MTQRANVPAKRESKAALFVDDGGTGGIPVVFIHSTAGNTEHWTAQLVHLRRTRRAIALDMRGHGRSAEPEDGDYSIEAMASDIGALASRLGLDRFVLVGHSLGAVGALTYASQHPQRVAGLFLVDPASDGRAIPPEQAAGLMAALRSEAYLSTVEAHWDSMLGPSSPAVRARLHDDLRASPRRAVIDPLENLLRYDAVTPLRSYEGPKLSLISLLNEAPAALHVLAPDTPHRKVDGAATGSSSTHQISSTPSSTPSSARSAERERTKSLAPPRRRCARRFGDVQWTSIE